MPPEWTVIIPVKVLSRAKTRLGSAESANATLAFAFFQDALTAVEASASVGSTVVATSDPVVAAWAAGRGATVVDDSAANGINAAAAAAARAVGLDGPAAVIVSDLPCLTAAALEGVLGAALGNPSSFLRDAAGSGTTMWFSAEGRVDSHFGPDSAAAHLAAGATDLALVVDPAVLALACRDVDTADDLAAARALGVGRYTAALVGAPVVVTVAAECVVDRVDVVPVVDEGGRWHELPSDILANAGFRMLRVGQRLVVDLDPTGSVATARLP